MIKRIKGNKTSTAARKPTKPTEPTKLIEPIEFVGSFWQGVSVARPIVIGYLGIGLTCGIAGAKSGLLLTEIAFLSLILFAGSAQFVFAQLWVAGAWVLWPTIFFLNFRHFLYSASFAPAARKLSPGMRFAIGAQLTDETFSLASALLNGRPLGAGSWMLGLNMASYSSWCFGNVFGFLLTDYLQGIESLGLDFALPSMYIAILVLLIAAFNERRMVICSLVGISAGATLLLGLISTHPANILIAASLAASIGLVLFGPSFKQKKGAGTQKPSKQPPENPPEDPPKN